MRLLSEFVIPIMKLYQAVTGVKYFVCSYEIHFGAEEERRKTLIQKKKKKRTEEILKALTSGG
jgi:uncharacterized protein YbcI